LNIPYRLYSASPLDWSNPSACLLFFHGGGFTIGSLDTHEYQRYGNGYLLDHDTVDWFFKHFLLNEANFTDWRFAPLNFARLHAVAPAWLALAVFDPLVDDALAHAQRLRQANIATQCTNYPDMMHAFFQHGGHISIARQAHEDMVQAMRAFGMARD
jgi:acetyl esterase